MSTLYESEKTHQQMLPQSADAESASADNLKGKDETRRGLKGNPATVVQHGRAETVRGHLHRQRHCANLASVGEAGDRLLAAPPAITTQREFVLDMHGHPLMPCYPTRARKLLHARQARVHCLVPFVIRLMNRVGGNSEIGPAARVGLSLTTARAGDFSPQAHFR
ncbi:MAG: RRXRR domain-containing protein [Acidimicrobiales bacterium]